MRYWLWLPLVCMASPLAASPILNGSFETGDFSGWTITIDVPVIRYDDGDGQTPDSNSIEAGMAAADLPFSFFEGWPHMAPRVVTEDFFTPVAGDFYGQLSGNGAGGDYYTPIDTHYYTRGQGTITLSQTLTLSAGDTVRGLMAFFTYDYPSYDVDQAFVTIDGPSGTRHVAEISVRDAYGEAAWARGDDLFGVASPWTPWEWQAPASGTYTLTLGNVMDDQEDSYAAFDNIRVEPVPEPGTTVLALLSAWVVAIRRR